jgi:hypothetical protein
MAKNKNIEDESPLLNVKGFIFKADYCQCGCDTVCCDIDGNYTCLDCGLRLNEAIEKYHYEKLKDGDLILKDIRFDIDCASNEHSNYDTYDLRFSALKNKTELIKKIYIR